MSMSLQEQHHQHRVFPAASLCGLHVQWHAILAYMLSAGEGGDSLEVWVGGAVGSVAASGTMSMLSKEVFIFRVTIHVSRRC